MAEFDVGNHGVGAVSVLNVIGFLDAHTAPELENAFNGLINEKQFKVVVNFSDLQYISSAGLGVFMAYVETMRENRGDIKFCGLKDDVYNIFDLLGFPLLYEFYKDEKEAIEKYNQG
jgi:anti-sigma B factor antagonist